MDPDAGRSCILVIEEGGQEAANRGRCHVSAGPGLALARGVGGGGGWSGHREGEGWRKVAVAGAALVCCAALIALAGMAGGGGGGRGPAEMMQGIPLTGKNTFLLSVPTGGGKAKLPSWSQLAGGDSENDEVDVPAQDEGKPETPAQSVGSDSDATEAAPPDDPEVGPPATPEYVAPPFLPSSVSGEKDANPKPSLGAPAASTAPSPHDDASGSSDSSYNSFLGSLIPGEGDDGGSVDDSVGDGGDGDSDGMNMNPQSDVSDDSAGSETVSSDEGGDGDSDGGGQGGEHRSATTVVHRLSREFEERFGESSGAYDFCIRDKLTQEELASCIKHMLMKSRPDYQPSKDQALLDKVAVLRLQIREEQTQSARALRQAHDKVEELKTRLLTAVPYTKFKELRVEYETKLRALERLVMRFTRDMASENEAARREGTYAGTADEVAKALGARIRRNEGDERIRALWRLLAKRIRDRRIEREREGEDQGEGDDGSRRSDSTQHCCKSIHKAIPKLMPFLERRNYVQRVRSSGADPMDYIRGGEGSQRGAGGERGATASVHRLSRSFDRREDKVAAAPPVGGQQSAAETADRPAQLVGMDPGMVAKSASQQTNAALSAAGSKAQVKAMPSLPSLPGLKLPKSMTQH